MATHLIRFLITVTVIQPASGIRLEADRTGLMLMAENASNPGAGFSSRRRSLLRTLPAVSFLLGLAGLIIYTGGTRSPEAAKLRFLERGNKYYEQEKYEEASILYRRALQEDRRYAEAYHRLGLTSLRLNNLEAAHRSFLRAFELEPHDLEAFRHLADLYLLALAQPRPIRREETLTSLISLTERAAAASPYAFEVRYAKGRIALVQGDFEDALPLLTKAVEDNPEDLPATLALAAALVETGDALRAEQTVKALISSSNSAATSPPEFLYRLYVRQRRFEDAERILRDMCEAQPRQTARWVRLAAHMELLGEAEGARALLDSLLANPGDHPDALIQIGDYFAVTRRSDQAISLFRKGIEADPACDRDYRIRIARAYLDRKMWTKAREEIDALLDCDPSDSGALAARGVIHLESGDPDRLPAAVADLEAAAAKAPKDAIVRYHLGRALLARGQFINARAQFGEAIRTEPLYLAPKYALIELHLSRGEFAQAELLAKDVLQMRPLELRAKTLRAVALIGVRDYQGARSELEDVLAVRPSNHDAIHYLGRLELIEGKLNQAEARFRLLANANPPDPRGLQGLLDTYLAKGRIDLARRRLEKALQELRSRLDADSALRLRLSLARLSVLQGDLEEAETLYRAILAGEPGNGVASVRLGQLALGRDDRPAAREFFVKAMKARPPQPLAAHNLGTMSAQEGRLPEARTWLERCLELAPDFPPALNNLAFVLAKSNAELDRALTLSQRAVAKWPDNPEYHDTLALVYIKRGLADRAAEVMGGVVARHPDRADFRFRYGLALFLSRRPGSAREHLERALALGLDEPQAAQAREMIALLGS